MILSAYERARSPWVHLQWAMKPGEPKRYVKTAIRKDMAEPEKSRRISLALADLQTKLLRGQIQEDACGDSAGDNDSASGWKWVLPFLQVKYAGRRSTLLTYQRLWRNIIVYIAEKEIIAPAVLEREHAFNYVEWRTAQVKQKSRKSPKLNTALGELKFLGLLMDEAVSRSYCSSNPVRKLGIEKEETDIKPEITNEEQRIIEAELASEPVWMQRAFKVAIRTGLRFGDTRISRAQVRWQDEQILIEKPKGGRKREFCIPIYDSIRPLLKEWWNTKESHTWTLPPKEREITGLLWHRFFDRIGLPHLCFHSTRVTFITRGLRAGIPEPVMMQMVNHGSALINRIYQRWTSAGVREFASKIPDPCGDSSK